MAALLKFNLDYIMKSKSLKIGLTIILTAQLMQQMDYLIVVVALPQIQKELGFTLAELSWIPNAFGLAFGGLLLLGGRIGDLLGQVKAFKIGLTLFVLASLMGGLANSPTILIVARVLQGIGAAVSAPSILALITVMATNEVERNRNVSLFIAISSVGASLGLILGGFLTEVFSWRWSLLINVPIGAIVIFFVSHFVPETSKKSTKLDVGGAISATLASVLLVYGFISAAENGWSSKYTLISFVFAAISLGTFLAIEKKHKSPLLDLNILKNKSRVGGLIVMALILGMHISALFFIIQFFQKVLNYNALWAGAGYIPVTAVVFFFSQYVPKLIEKFGSKKLLAMGSILVGISLYLFSMLNTNSTYALGIFFPLVIHALGVALVLTPATVVIMDGVPEDQSGSVSGLLQMDQQIGAAVGIAVITSIYSIRSTPDNFILGLSESFITSGSISILAAVITWKLVTNKKHKSEDIIISVH